MIDPFHERGRSSAVALAFALIFFSTAADAVPPAAETGACSLEDAIPSTVALVDDGFDLLLDDGRRVALSGLEFPPVAAAGAPDLRAAAHKRMTEWLTGRDVFVGVFAASADRWGRLPARVFAASETTGEQTLISVAAALLEEGLARFRPDAPAAPCAKDYLAAEAPARDGAWGLWANPLQRPVDAAAEGTSAALLQRKGMTLVEGVIQSVGESRGAIYLNFGKKRMEDFSVVILRRNLAIFQASGIDLRTLIGRQARVRGLIETGFGPRMEISAPAEIEILENPAP